MHLPNSLSASSAAATVGLVTSALPMRRNHLPAMNTNLQKRKRHAARCFGASWTEGFLHSVFLKQVGLRSCEWLKTWQKRESEAQFWLCRRDSSCSSSSVAMSPSALRKPMTFLSASIMYPSCVAASIVLWSTNVQCFWCMSILVQVFVVIETFRPGVLRKSSGGCAGQRHATVRVFHGSAFIRGLYFLTHYMSRHGRWHDVHIGKALLPIFVFASILLISFLSLGMKIFFNSGHPNYFIDFIALSYGFVAASRR